MSDGFVWIYLKYFLGYITGYDSFCFLLESFTTEFFICFALMSIKKNSSFTNLGYFISSYMKNKTYVTDIHVKFHHVSIKDYRKIDE